jgi:Serine dehydrogenase proteinase
LSVYSEYLDKRMNADQLAAERKRLLREISVLRGRDLLVYAGDINKAQQGAAVALTYDDLLPIRDQLDNLNGKAIDVILETGGGSGEVAEDIVRILRAKYASVAFIIPGIAKSAGTIMAMSGDEILMDAGSALGPIDAQIQFEGKQFSAEALLKGFEKIKEESEKTKTLNRAYIPMLQRISPGDLQHADNALEFARRLVRDWLKVYKFQNWSEHRTHKPGQPVTEAEKDERAGEIANHLCDHSRWLTHGRSIRMEDLKQLGLEISDFSADPKLGDLVKRYDIVLKMLFSMTNVCKVIETPNSQILRFFQQATIPFPFPAPNPNPLPLPSRTPKSAVPQSVNGVIVGIQCGNCKKTHNLQADFDKMKPIQPGMVPFPPNDLLNCDQCGNQLNVAALRQQIETQTKRRIARS